MVALASSASTSALKKAVRTRRCVQSGCWSRSLFENACLGDTVPWATALCSALFVHGYEWVHTSIYIGVHIYIYTIYVQHRSKGALTYTLHHAMLKYEPAWLVPCNGRWREMSSRRRPRYRHVVGYDISSCRRLRYTVSHLTVYRSLRHDDLS